MFIYPYTLYVDKVRGIDKVRGMDLFGSCFYRNLARVNHNLWPGNPFQSTLFQRNTVAAEKKKPPKSTGFLDQMAARQDEIKSMLFAEVRPDGDTIKCFQFLFAPLHPGPTINSAQHAVSLCLLYFED